MHHHEEALVRAFMVPGKRDRYLTLLGNPKRRAKILDRLNHLAPGDLDPRFASPLPSNTDIARLLTDYGAPTDCYVISDVADLDGREMALEDAIGEIEAGMFGSLVSCIPGKLGYYYGEWGNPRLLLRRE